MSRPRISRACCLRLVRVVGELDAARLAAAAGEHLGLDDDRAAELLGRRARLRGRRREPALGDGDPEAREELLALVLVEVQAAGETRCATLERCAALLVASALPSSPAAAPRPACRSRRRLAPPQQALLEWRETYPRRVSGSSSGCIRSSVGTTAGAEIAMKNETKLSFAVGVGPRPGVRPHAAPDRRPGARRADGARRTAAAGRPEPSTRAAGRARPRRDLAGHDVGTRVAGRAAVRARRVRCVWSRWTIPRRASRRT